MNLFPMMQPNVDEQDDISLAVYRDVKWDFTNNRPVFEQGAPVWVEGAEAVKSWIARAVQTSRGRYEEFSFSYGNDIEDMIGENYTKDATQAEVERALEECLLQSAYIDSVQDITLRFDQAGIHVQCTVHTIYGEEEVNV